MEDRKSPLTRIVTWTILGILAVIAFRLALRVLGILMGVLGIVFGLVTFIVFTIGPVVLVGWLVMKAWKAFTKEPVV